MTTNRSAPPATYRGWRTLVAQYQHIHHLSPRIPNYHLQQCHDQNPTLQRVAQLTLQSSLQTVWLALWDEDQRRLVTFHEARHVQGSAAPGA
jgi:omega-6 fatty acid desaturase (delta-12 desaturase)